MTAEAWAKRARLRIPSDDWNVRKRPVWARGRCRISPPRFLAECCKRQLNQGSFVLLYFRLFAFSALYWVCLSVFSCNVLFVSISQVIGCEDRLRNDLYCVEWGVKLCSNQPTYVNVRALSRTLFYRTSTDRAMTRSTQSCISPGSLNRVPASAGVRVGMSPLPGGR